MAIPPAKSPNILGILGGDLLVSPTVACLDDAVVSNCVAVAGATYPLVNASIPPDKRQVRSQMGDSGQREALLPVQLPLPGCAYDGFNNPS